MRRAAALLALAALLAGCGAPSADLFVVNKSDRPGADRLRKDLSAALHLRARSDWTPPVVPTMAGDGTGIPELRAALDRHHQYLIESGTLVVTPLAPIEDTWAVEIEMTGDPQDRFPTPLLIPQGSARTLLLAKAALKGDGLLTLADRGAARTPEDRESARLPEMSFVAALAVRA